MGEEAAACHLEARGWTILDRNVRRGHEEIDLIAWRAGTLAFVEVKSRRGEGFGDPLEAITPAKRRAITRVARGWLMTRSLPAGTVLRFDAVAVRWREVGPPVIRHIPDAWRSE
jgi:putative endonuclease